MESTEKNEENNNSSRTGGCGFCKMMFDGFCGKSCRDVPFDTFWNTPPFRPDWCEGQEYTDKFHY